MTRVARKCEPDSLDEHKVKGKIVVCEYHVDEYSIEDRLNEVKNKGSIGFLFVIPDDELIVAPKLGVPVAVITQGDGIKIHSYINSTSRTLQHQGLQYLQLGQQITQKWLGPAKNHHYSTSSQGLPCLILMFLQLLQH